MTESASRDEEKLPKVTQDGDVDAIESPLEQPLRRTELFDAFEKEATDIVQDARLRFRPSPGVRGRVAGNTEPLPMPAGLERRLVEMVRRRLAGFERGAPQTRESIAEPHTAQSGAAAQRARGPSLTAGHGALAAVQGEEALELELDALLAATGSDRDLAHPADVVPFAEAVLAKYLQLQPPLSEPRRGPNPGLAASLGQLGVMVARHSPDNPAVEGLAYVVALDRLPGVSDRVTQRLTDVLLSNLASGYAFHARRASSETADKEHLGGAAYVLAQVARHLSLETVTVPVTAVSTAAVGELTPDTVRTLALLSDSAWPAIASSTHIGSAYLTALAAAASLDSGRGGSAPKAFFNAGVNLLRKGDDGMTARMRIFLNAVPFVAAELGAAPNVDRQAWHLQYSDCAVNLVGSLVSMGGSGVRGLTGVYELVALVEQFVGAFGLVRGSKLYLGLRALYELLPELDGQTAVKPSAGPTVADLAGVAIGELGDVAWIPLTERAWDQRPHSEADPMRPDGAEFLRVREWFDAPLGSFGDIRKCITSDYMLVPPGAADDAATWVGSSREEHLQTLQRIRGLSEDEVVRRVGNVIGNLEV